MTVGERIKFFRKRKGLTQKELGEMLGFSENQCDVRIAQYERGARKPKANIKKALAEALDVNVMAISDIDTDSPEGLMHLFFMLEDQYGMKIEMDQSKVCLVFNAEEMDKKLFLMMLLWFVLDVSVDYGLWSRKGYDRFRYNFPDAIRQDKKTEEAFRSLLESIEMPPDKKRKRQK